MGIMDKMKQAKDMYGNMKKMQQEVDKIVVEASSRNKLITVSAKGNHQILSIKIDDQLQNSDLRDIEKPENHSFEPTSSEMLDFAINRSLKFEEKGCKGFFIMVEGSQVDWAGHANNINYLKREMQDFDEAVQNALDYAKQNQDTLVIVTADHETGGLLIEPAAPADYTAPEVKFSFKVRN